MNEPMATGTPTHEDWQRAVALVRAHYPLEVFPWPSDSLEGKVAFMARQTCDNILREAHRFAAERIEA